MTDLLPPRERIDTLPVLLPKWTLGYHAAAWMVDNLIQPNGPHAGGPFIPTDRQISFLAHWYEVNEQGEFVYMHGVRRLSKGSGKMLSLEERVITPSGWRRYGDLRVGDEVFGVDGRPTVVEQVHPIRTPVSYRLTLSDGSFVDAGEEHLWALNDGRVMTTVELRRLLPLERCQLPESPFYEGPPRFVASIAPISGKPMRCITVAAKDGLFIVGEGMIVTHNSPFAAALGLFELCGPCRFEAFDPDAPFGIRTTTQKMPLVQVVATSEQQVENTMRMVRAFSNKNTPLAKKYDLDPGKTYIETPDIGKLQQMTSSASTLEGAEISFQLADESEHWLPNKGGPAMMETIKQNAAKTGARVLETSNAWVPGEGSVAEASFEAWCAQEEGKTRGDVKILYDARMAPANAVLHDDPKPGEMGLTEALEYVYEDAPWANLRAIKARIWDPSYPESRSMRFFFNKPNASESAWLPLDEWVILADRKRKVEDGEDIVMFFDGSKSNDHTALVGCCMSDGHVFKVGHWVPDKYTKNVNVGAVDLGVRAAFERWNVVAFWADVREWESFVRTSWPDLFGDQLICHAVKGGMNASPIAWDMRSHAYQFAEAVEATYNEIQEKVFTHDGDGELGVHVSNCRVNEYKGLFSVKKESPKSSKKIDLAVCMIGARMLYRHVKQSKEWAEMNKPKGGWAVL